MKGRFGRRLVLKETVAEEVRVEAASNRPERSKRAAYAHPRALVSVMAVLLMAGSWWAMAQKNNAPRVATKPTPIAKKTLSKPLTWNQLPSLVRAYGERRAVQAQLASTQGAGNSAGARLDFPRPTSRRRTASSRAQASISPRP